MFQRERPFNGINSSKASAGNVKENRHPAPAELPPLEKILHGEWREAESGLAFVKETCFEPDLCHGTLRIGAMMEVAPEALAMLSETTTFAHPSELAFFDAETTGLSGGTGTYIFLAGLGSFEEGAFRLRQYFLPNLEGERAMLEAFSRDLSRFQGLVTYNGRAFDMPLLQTRLTLARLEDRSPRHQNLDLLYAVRSIYRQRLPGCRLADAEKHLLGVERVDDVPGHLMPSFYFDYIRAGRISQLMGAFRHNAADILSIAGCLAFIGSLLTRPNIDGTDALALARWWDLRGDVPRAESFYRAALPRLEKDAGWAEAAGRFAGLLKRSGSKAEAVELWSRLWVEGNRAAGLELAKHLEHNERDVAAAEEITRALLVSADADEKSSIEHRLERLRRKLERSKPSWLKKALALRPAPCPTT